MSYADTESLRDHLLTVRKRLLFTLFTVAWMWTAAWLGPFLVAVLFAPYVLQSDWDISIVPFAAAMALFSSITFSGLGVVLLAAAFLSASALSLRHRIASVLIVGTVAGGAMLLLVVERSEMIFVVAFGASCGLTTAIVWLVLRLTIVSKAHLWFDHQ